jgi:hypothetical protein
MLRYCCLAGLAALCAFAADRPDLNGKWRLDSKEKDQVLSIVQKPDAIEIDEAVSDSGGKPKKIQIHCGTMGQECKVNEDGQPKQVTMYYNGPVLVMLEQWHGTDYVDKTRIKASDDGKTKTMEVAHIAPARKTENFTFVKQ